MMDPIRVDWDWFKVAIFTLIALVGGCLGYTARKLDAKEKFSLGVFFFEGISSAFFGFLIGLVSMEHDASLGWGGSIIGVLSWFGARSMVSILKPIVMKRLGLFFGVNTDEKSN